MSAWPLWIISLGLASLGLVLWASALYWRLGLSARAAGRIQKILRLREVTTLLQRPGLQTPSSTEPADTDTEAQTKGPKPPAWLESGIAQALLAEEDRKLLDQAGLGQQHAAMVYVASRLGLALGLPLLTLAVLQPSGIGWLLQGFLAFALGLMLPKWVMRSKVRKRREEVIEELPLLVDMLRLLQGVGLSVDQSLQILASEFGSVLPVLGNELALANRLYSAGRSRQQSLQRLSQLSEDDDLQAIIDLLVQVDRHGGAAQEPLRELGLRLRAKRQARFKEKIGTITVKMTGVMVLTLLPALLVITAGPGFMAVIRSLSNLGGI